MGGSTDIDIPFFKIDIYASLKFGTRGGFYLNGGFSIITNMGGDTAITDNVGSAFGFTGELGFLFILGNFRIGLYFKLYYYPNTGNNEAAHPSGNSGQVLAGLNFSYATF